MQKKNIIRIAIVVGLILLVPLFGNLFIEGWNWGIGSFIFAFFMLFYTGLTIDFAIRKITNPIYRVIAIIIIVLTLVLLWVEIVTDAVSSAIVKLFF